MMVFIDTEFTNFINPELLSIGLVTMDRQEFYAELDLDTELGRARVKASSDFVRFGGVLDLWGRIPGATCTLDEIALRVCSWLTNLSSSKSGEAPKILFIAYDHSADYALLEFLLRDAGISEGLRRRFGPFNVFRDTGTPAGRQAAEAYYTRSSGGALGRHHALTDAWALRAAYRASMRAKRLQKETDA